MTRLVPFAACVLLLTAASIRSQEPVDALGEDDALRAALTATAERVVLSERCGECHAAEFEVWEGTPHAAGFEELHRKDSAKAIYRRLGLRLIKRGTDETTPACLSCHYTPILRRDRLRAGAGVTCESCHGPARDWISIHNSYGVEEADFQRAALLETPAHRMQRIADSRAAGMRRPSDLYDVAANCFGCHTVPNEELVNRGGHSTGSDIEFLEWSERIRHNFLESYKTADGRTNAERPAAWKRMMYVVGRALDLEYAVRGIAAATSADGNYHGAMSDRAGYAVDALAEINDYAPLPAIQQIIATLNTVDLAPDNGPALRAAADAMRAATKQFIAGADGSALEALDPLWDPTAEDVAVEPPAARVMEIPDIPVSLPLAEDATTVATPETASRVAGERQSPAAPGPAGQLLALNVPVAPTAGTPATSTPPDAVPAPVRIETLTRPPWRDPPGHAFVKVPCGRCHSPQESWWRDDPHSETAKPFRANEPRNVEIALAYGVAAGDMAKGDRICMWCHGTPGRRPSSKVRAGVGCQRCHGAGADYVDSHDTDGYTASLALGMTDLRDPAIQAVTCAGCHYITDQGLIDAGHPVGDGFDMRLRIDRIVHSGAAFDPDTSQPVDRDLLAAAYTRIVDERGPAPLPRPTAQSTLALASASAPAAETGANEPRLSSARAGARSSAQRVPAAAGVTTSGRPAQPARAAAASPPPRASFTLVPVRPPRSPAVPGASRSRQRSRATPTLVADPGLDALRLDPHASVEETLEALRRRIATLYSALAT